MSRLNIIGIINNIKSKTNVYTPLIEAIVNSIEAITERGSKDGEITITLKREKVLEFDDSMPSIHSIEIQDNGVGFTTKNRDSFDTFYSAQKKNTGGKGFGRFMFLKYFDNVRVESIYHDDEQFFSRKFIFGKEFDIIVGEENVPTTESKTGTRIYLNNILDSRQLDKGIDTISRKLCEKLLIFFINENFNCPTISIREEDGTSQMILNDFLKKDDSIQHIGSRAFVLENSITKRKESFVAKVFKIYFASQKSKISLTAHNREVTDVSLQTYIPQFEDDFYDIIDRGNIKVRKNYIIKSYVLGEYLDSGVSLERETFNFDKAKADAIYPFSQTDIETQAAEVTKEFFKDDVKVRVDKKKKDVIEYVNHHAPWHKAFVKDIDFSNFPYNSGSKEIELELQKIKFSKEQEVKFEIQEMLDANEGDFDDKLSKLVAKVSEIGRNDLAHYVCNRKIVLQAFEELLKRRNDGSAELEKEVHKIVFPMGRDSENTLYEDHNLWLLDERLVFSEYIASDRKISKKKDALGEPDLVIFDQKRSFRNGDNEFSNPLTIFEFKRPKRENYKQEDDPVVQVAKYLDDIRAGKYEMPEGLEKIKVNSSTPVYAYVVCDITPKIQDFARIHQLTVSADAEGFFGFHSGYQMYIEILSFRKLLKDATLRNKVFFKKLGIE